MSRLSIKLGFWSAVLCVIVSVGYGIGVVLSFIFPLPSWTNLASFVANAQPLSLVCYTLIQVMAFLLAPIDIVLLCSLHEYASDDKKILTRIGLCCMIATMVLGNQLYFVHFNAMRLAFSKEVLMGLEQFVEWNPHSLINASGALGWTFFVGLAFLFVAPIFSGGRLERGLRYASLILGSCSILGMAGVLLGNLACLAIYFIGDTVAGIILAILASILFKRLGAASKVPKPILQAEKS